MNISTFCCIWLSGFCFSSLFLLDLILVNLNWNPEFMFFFLFVLFLKCQTQIYLLWYLMKLNSLIRLCLNFKIESIGYFFFAPIYLFRFQTGDNTCNIWCRVNMIFVLWRFILFFFFFFGYSNRHLRRKRLLLRPRSQPNPAEESRRRRFDNVFGFRIWFFFSILNFVWWFKL